MHCEYFNNLVVSAAICAAVGGPPSSGSKCLQELFAEENRGELESALGLKLREWLLSVGSGKLGTP
jgi:hypothetical protein